MRILFIMLCMLTCMDYASAQQNRLYGGSGFFDLSFARQNLSPLNQALQKSGVPELPAFGFGIGGSGHFFFNNLVIGGHGAGYSLQHTSNSIYKTELASGYGFFDMGYVVFNHKKHFCYPLLGVGGGGYDLSLYKRSSSMHFDSLSSGANGQTRLLGNALLLNVSLNSEHFFSGSEAGFGGLALGLSIGYLFSPASLTWESNQQKVNGAPAMHLNSFYVKLKIGAGGMAKKKRNPGT